MDTQYRSFSAGVYRPLLGREAHMRMRSTAKRNCTFSHDPHIMNSRSVMTTEHVAQAAKSGISTIFISTAPFCRSEFSILSTNAPCSV